MCLVLSVCTCVRKKIHTFFIHFLCVLCLNLCVCMHVCVCEREKEKQNQQLNLSLQHKNWILQMSGSSLIAVCGLSQQFFDFRTGIYLNFTLSWLFQGCLCHGESTFICFVPSNEPGRMDKDASRDSTFCAQLLVSHSLPLFWQR